MAFSGQVLRNPVSTECLVLHTTAGSGTGMLLDARQLAGGTRGESE
jgi:hypothetical protein